MKTRWLAVVLLSLFAVSIAVAQAAPAAKTPAAKSGVAAQTKSSAPTTPAAKPWEKIPIPPLAPFHPQEPKRIELKNGMVIFLQEDHELPFIGGSANVRAGSRSEPANKTGLIDIYGEAWRTGGTKSKTGDQMDDYLAARAARIETGGGGASTSISFNCLKGNLDQVFPLFLELLREPAFREDKIQISKLQMNSAIARRNDDVGGIAGREATRLAYGKDNPYARIPEYATIAAVTRDDLVKWHDTYVHPNNIMVGISGDFDSAAMEQKLRRAFESWERAPVPGPAAIQFHEPQPKVYFVAKEDVNQSEIRMVSLGIERNNPDYFTVEVMNEVLGGGFSSRLFKAIRTEKGLAYSVGGGLGASFDHPGTFSIGMGTKSSSTVDAIQALRTELGNMLTHPATAEEVKEAKDSILNRFIFNFDSKSKVLGERMLYEFYRYPADFLERYRAGIEKTTPADVDRVAHKYIHSDQFAVLIVGNDKEFVKPLSTLGTVTPIDISIPEGTTPQPSAGAEEAAPAKPAQTDPQAKALLEKFVAFIGGADKVNAVKAIRQVSSAEQNTPQGTIALDTDTYTEFPDQFHSIVRTAQLAAPMHVIVSSAGAWMSMEGQGTRDMPASMKQDRLSSIRRGPLAIAQHLSDLTIAMGEKAADGQTINISGDGVNVRWVLDPQTGRLLRSSFTASGQAGPVQRTIEFSDWRPAGGLNLPYKATVQENGQPAGSEQIKSYEINPKIDPKLFEKPNETPQ
jgi:zinc protease